MENNSEETTTTGFVDEVSDVRNQSCTIEQNQDIAHLFELSSTLHSLADTVFAVAKFEEDKEGLDNRNWSHPDEPIEWDYLDFLHQSLDIDDIRRSLLENPVAINAAIQELPGDNSDVLDVIVADPEEFLKMLLNNSGEEDPGTSGCNIEITDEDTQDSGRLMAQGHSDLNAAQTYYACGKNDELAMVTLHTNDEKII